MKLSDFDFNLPKNLIAQTPSVPRDSSKLLYVNQNGDLLDMNLFSNITKLISSNDVLVLNDTKVIPALLRDSKQ